ncbi:MAG: hypothetical protein H7328_00690 [Bdellovibrio sp.]|nr:hypothetical protein [Bdellovibrio sp.]
MIEADFLALKKKWAGDKKPSHIDCWIKLFSQCDAVK